MEFISSVIRWLGRLGNEEDQESEGNPIPFNNAPRNSSRLFSEGLEDVSIPPTSSRIYRDSISTDGFYDLQNIFEFDLSSYDSLQQEAFISSSSASFLSHHRDSIFDGTSQQDRISVAEVLVTEERWINHYSSCQKILLVGEGDFSFSASLASAFGSASNMIATSLDSREFLRENYRRALSNIESLTNKGCRVIHDVDATVMAKNPLLKGMKFDRIVFNFPFAGFFKEFPREYELRRHQKLVSRFLKNAKEMIKESGEIHITHKTNSFHREWNIEQLASSNGLRLIEAVDFRHKDYPGYRTMCGFGGNNFFCCYPCKTYKFGLQVARGP